MQVSVEITSGLGRRLTIGVPAARVEAEVAARLEKAAPATRPPHRPPPVAAKAGWRWLKAVN